MTTNQRRIQKWMPIAITNDNIKTSEIWFLNNKKLDYEKII